VSEETSPHLGLAIQSAAYVLAEAALSVIQADPHQWSERPCQTCKAVGAIFGKAFGCYLYAHQQRERRQPKEGTEK
jgi:hypothetical protein